MRVRVIGIVAVAGRIGHVSELVELYAEAFHMFDRWLREQRQHDDMLKTFSDWMNVAPAYEP
jgi:hypothetical protein